MSQRNEIALLLSGIAGGTVVGAAIGLAFSAVAPGFGFAAFFFAVFGSYIGMLVADRRRIALRRAAAAQATAQAAQPARPPVPRRPAAKGRQSRR